MNIIINGTRQKLETESSATLDRVLKDLGYETEMNGMAVAVNDAVIPKHEWPEYQPEENDRLEIIRATQGG